MSSPRRNSPETTPLDLEVERLLRDVPESDGGVMDRPVDSWEEEEFRLARMRDQAAEDVAKQEPDGGE